MPLETSFISGFFGTVEGQRQSVGYIPCHRLAGGTANYKGHGSPTDYRAMGASGVTIATGCDLGQTNAETLYSYGLADSIVNCLVPYIGKKRDDALNVLHRIPLTISADTAEAIDLAVHGGYIRRYVIPAFERDCAKMRFADIPKQAQAAIASICFQKGVGGTKRDAPNTWTAFVRCDWNDAASRLCNRALWNEYQNRRVKEGEMLKGAV